MPAIEAHVWRDLVVLLFGYTVGTIVLGHFEERTPKPRRIAKLVAFTLLVGAISMVFGSAAVLGLLAIGLVFFGVVHFVILPRHGIHPITGEPRERYYAFRGLDPAMTPAEFLGDYTLRNVVLGSALLGIVSGALGCFALLRRQALLGDAIAHAALPGICMAFLLSGSRAPIVLLLGAAASGWVGGALVQRLSRGTRLSEDSSLAIVLTSFFGLGIVLLTVIAGRGDAAQAGLDRYLFGQAATMVEESVLTIAALGAAALGLLLLGYKELKLLAFDPAFADALGFRSGWLSLALTSLLVIAIVIGLQAVGVVLMAAMLIGPAAAARQWTNRLGPMIVIAAGVGAASGVVGAVASATQSRLPTGPAIVLTLTLLVAFSLFFGAARGLVWDAIGRAAARRTA